MTEIRKDTAMQLVKYDAMCTAIAEAYSVDEVKEIRDKALAFEAYAQQAKNTEAERKACEIRLRAERKAGQLLRDMKERGERSGGRRKESRGVILSDINVTPNQSSKWQQLADIPEAEFEMALAGPDKPSTAGLIKKKQKPMDEDALWLWGRLRDFENKGLLDRDANDLFSKMTNGMQADTTRLSALVSSWLEEFND